jgi:hypothetical protein
MLGDDGIPRFDYEVVWKGPKYNGEINDNTAKLTQLQG